MNITTANDLPDVMTSILPIEAQQLFIEVYNREKLAGFPDATSFEIAWLVIKSKFRQVEGYWVAMSEDFTIPTLYTFELSDSETKVVMNSENEELVIDAILADNTPNTEGKFFTTEELEDIALQINTQGSTLPDVDHEKLKGLITKYGNNIEAIKTELREEKGIFKSIKAVVEKGKLWIQAALDKRYKNHTDKFKKLSIEALADSDFDGRLRKPKYMGFTFTNTPKLINADIVKVAI